MSSVGETIMKEALEIQGPRTLALISPATVSTFHQSHHGKTDNGSIIGSSKEILCFCFKQDDPFCVCLGACILQWFIAAAKIPGMR